jgi:hypothetical protein
LQEIIYRIKDLGFEQLQRHFCPSSEQRAAPIGPEKAVKRSGN